MVTFYREWRPSWGVSVLTQTCAPGFSPCQVLLDIPLPSGCPCRILPSLLLAAHGHHHRASDHAGCSWGLSLLGPADVLPLVPSNKTKPECASPPGNLRMSASCPFLQESQTSSVPVCLKAGCFPVRTQNTLSNSLTACVSRDCGFLFTDQPLAPGTK